MIPWGTSIRVQWRDRREIGVVSGNHRLWIWFPLFLVWLVLAPVVIVLFPVVALASVFLGISGVELYATAWQLLSSLRRTLIEVESPEVLVRVKVW
jgi:hypothetical protein